MHPAANDDDNETAELVFWIEALQRTVAELDRDRRQMTDAPAAPEGRLRALADAARAMAFEMDFAFLVDPERKLLSIGYSLVDNSLDPSCYDLLASEARLASLFAIAKGDVPDAPLVSPRPAARHRRPRLGVALLVRLDVRVSDAVAGDARARRQPARARPTAWSCSASRSYGRTLGVPWGDLGIRL